METFVSQVKEQEYTATIIDMCGCNCFEYVTFIPSFMSYGHGVMCCCMIMVRIFVFRNISIYHYLLITFSSCYIIFSRLSYTTEFGPAWDSNSQPSDIWANT